MNPEIKKKWLKALRSGEYKQGRNLLRSNTDHYCCLGVLCDILNPNGWEKSGDSYSMNGKTEYLPEDIQLESMVAKDKEEKLAYFNDKGTPFSEIAKWISRYL